MKRFIRKGFFLLVEEKKDTIAGDVTVCLPVTLSKRRNLGITE